MHFKNNSLKNVTVLHSWAVHSASLNFLSCIVFVHKRCTASKTSVPQAPSIHTTVFIYNELQYIQHSFSNRYEPKSSAPPNWGFAGLHHCAGRTSLKKKKAASHAPPNCTLKPHDGKCTIQNLQKKRANKAFQNCTRATSAFQYCILNAACCPHTNVELLAHCS